jgi:hypothetical protein
MKRKYNVRLITSRRSYTPEDVAQLFGINKKTVFRWLKEGLRPLEENTKPFLIMGEELSHFLTEQKKKQRLSLKKDEFFCLKCRKAVLAKAGTEKNVPTGNKIGKEARIQFFRRAKCEQCGKEVNRLV